MRLLRTCLLVAALCPASVLVSAAPAQGAEPATGANAPAPKIAVLRLEEVLNRSKPWIAGTDAARRTKAELDQQVSVIDEKIRSNEGSLQVLKPDNENYARIQEENETWKLKRKMLVQRTGGELERRQVALVKEAFKDVRTALAAFCRERGVMLVHSAPSLELGAPTLQDIQLELGLKPVLYFDPSLDITDAFMTYLGERQSASAPATAPAAASTNPAAGEAAPVGK